jgi:hypothetical protein
VNAADDTRESRRCPGCQVVLPVSNWSGGPSGYHASPECAEVAGALLGYEIDHQLDLGHLHQLRIDAYGAQHVGPRTRPITTVFALNGLYMYLERGSGNLDVRTAHGIMANSYSDWPVLTPPEQVGRLTAHAVLQAGAVGVREVEERLIEWAGQVWAAWPGQDQQVVRDLTDKLVPERYFHR